MAVSRHDATPTGDQLAHHVPGRHYAAVRPDRLRYDWNALGDVVDTVDGAGVSLNYTYDTLNRLTGIYESQSCPGSVTAIGTPSCRGVTIAYNTNTALYTSATVTDVAGRPTTYNFTVSGAKHYLTSVVNPAQPSTSPAPGSNPDQVSYAYQGVNSASCSGAAAGQMCSVVDEDGSTTSFTYSAGQQLPSGVSALPRVATVTDRRGTVTTLTYGANTTTAVTAAEETLYSQIDSIGRVGQIASGTSAGVFSHVTAFTWETGSSSCTEVSSSGGTPTFATVNDNELCDVDQQSLVSGTPDRQTVYDYDPQGQTIRSGSLISGSTWAWTTAAYTTQYVDNTTSPSSSDTAVTDAVSGAGQVAVGNHGAQLSNVNLLYVVTDQIQSLTPNGNASSPTGGYQAYVTTYTPAENTSAAPNTFSSFTASGCSGSNSGVLCSQSTPYNLTPAFETTTYTYDPFGQKLTQTIGNVTGSGTAEPETTSYLYYGENANGSSATTPVPTGDSHHTDEEGWLENVTDATGEYVLFQYDAAGDVYRTFDRNATGAAGFNPTTATDYAQTSYGASAANPWRYVTSTRDPLGNTTSYVVNGNGDDTQIQSPNGNTTTQTFDANDDPLTTTLPNTTAQDSAQTTTHQYDAYGNTTATQDAMGAWTVYRYDPVNRLSATLTDRGPVSTVPTGCSTATGSTDAPIPSGDVVCIKASSYDGADNTTSSTDGTGQTTTFTHDGLGDTLTTVAPRSNGVSLTTTDQYDADGNKTVECSPRQAAEVGPGCTSTSEFATTTTYDQQDRAIATSAQRQAPGSPAAMVYLPATQALTTSKTFDPAGNEISSTDANGTTSTYSYNVLNRKTTSAVPRSASTTLATCYLYDYSGNETAVIAPPATGSCATGTNGPVTAYSYDADNRVLDTVEGASSTTASQAGTASADGGSNVRTRLAYDADGNTVKTWTPDAFRTSVTTPDNGYEQISVYDADDRLTTTYQPRFDNTDPEVVTGADATQCPASQTTALPSDYANVPGLVVCHVSYVYDKDGQRTAVWLPDYISTQSGGDARQYDYAYTPDQLLASLTTPDPSYAGSGGNPQNDQGVTADTYTYDGDGRQLTDTDVGGNVTTTAYTADGLTATVTDPPGPNSLSHATTYAYDANGDKTSTSVSVDSNASDNQTTTTQYNSDGTVLDDTDGAGDVTSYGYDADGHTVEVWSPSANSHASGATGAPDGNFASSRFPSPQGAADLQTATQYTFTLDGLTATELQPVDAAGTVFRLNTYSYDNGGDKAGDDISTQNASGTQLADAGSENWTYYPDGRMSADDGRAGDTTTYTYEPAGGAVSTALTRPVPAGTTSTTSQTYYLDGSQRTVTTDGTTTDDAYDAVGNPSTVTQTPSGGTTSTETFTYSDAELPASVGASSYGLGSISQTYDKLGRDLTTSYSTSGATVSRSWNPDNTLSVLSLVGGGTSTYWDYTYNGAYQQTATGYATGATGSTTSPTISCATGGGLETAGITCDSYDSVGRVSNVTDNIASRSVSYDHDSNRTGYISSAPSTATPSTSQTFNADDSTATISTNSGAGTATSSECYNTFGGLSYDQVGTAACVSSGSPAPTTACNTYTYTGYDTELSITDSGNTGCGTPYSSSFTRDARGRIETRTDTGTTPAGTTTDDYDGTTSQVVAEQTPEVCPSDRIGVLQFILVMTEGSRCRVSIGSSRRSTVMRLRGWSPSRVGQSRKSRGISVSRKGLSVTG